MNKCARRGVFTGVKNPRKICAGVFAALSLFFALVAVHNRFYACCRDGAGGGLQKAPFDESLEIRAREADKLVFVAIGAHSLSEKTKKILAKNYIFTELDPKLNPADFEVFNHFFTVSSYAKKPLECAVLTPKLNPVYLSAKIDGERLNKILPAAANAYAKNRELLRESAENFGAALPHSRALSFLRDDGNFSFSFARSLDNVPTAYLSENARLAFARYRTMRGFYFSNAAARAFEALKTRYDREKSPRKKMLLARAIASAAFAADARALSPADEQARFVLGNRFDGVYENALALSLSSRAALLFGKDEYAQRAAQIAREIMAAASGQKPFPSVLRECANSVADAYDIAAAANALCDYSAASGDKSALSAAAKLLAQLDALYSSNSMLALNSARSPSAAFARLSIFGDGERPSYTGEAMQAAAKLKILGANSGFSETPRWESPRRGAFARNFGDNGASVKLAAEGLVFADFPVIKKPHQ